MGEQGQSRITEDKERGFAGIFGMQLRIACAMFRNVSAKLRAKGMDVGINYFHFDLHAGSGYNHEIGVPGSPLVFLNVAQKYDVPYLLFCSEIDDGAVAELAKRLAPYDKAFLCPGDNAELVLAIPEIIKEYGERPAHARGTILLDPNNQRGDGLPWDELEEITMACPKLDVMVNFPGTAMKRIGRRHRDYVSLEDLPDILHKEHWLIRETLGVHQFTTVIGRNYKTGDYKKLCFYDWESPEGMQILRKVVKTRAEVDKEERAKQGELGVGDI